MEYLLVIIMVLIFAIVASSFKDSEDSENQLDMESFIKKEIGFDFSHRLIISIGLDALFLDDKKAKICIAIKRKNKYETTIYSFKDILESEIIENGNSLIKTSRGSQLGGSLIGGLALGGVGAIIGGLSGKKYNVERIKSIILRIVVNDTKNPIYDFKILNNDSNDGYEKESYIYIESKKEADLWHSLITILIKRADEEDGKIVVNNESNVDKLIELSKLVEKELLSKEEFEKEKAKLI